MYETVDTPEEIAEFINRHYASVPTGQTMRVTLRDRGITAKVEKPKSDFGRTATIEVTIHEQNITEGFTFGSSGNNYTQLAELGDTCEELAAGFQSEFDIASFDFSGVNSESISGGLFDGLSDRVFTYEQVIGEDRFE